MISAADALKLPTAQLSASDRQTAAHVLEKIEAHVRLNMSFRGCEFKTDVTNGNVMAEVNRVLKSLGWQTQFQALVEQSRVHGQAPRHTGFLIILALTDAAYEEAAKITRD